jgi:maltooligosyltrehalose trehalohydrolase
MTEHQHHMPFGAEVLEEGGVRFLLWAPGVDQVTLCLEGTTEETTLPMRAEADGWFVIETELAGHGARYRYRLPNDLRVPDPASRYQPEDVHGPSEVIDPGRWDWQDTDWRGQPWEQAIIYELHIGTFTPEGTFAAAMGRLDYLRELGVTAIEIMPIADFRGDHNWGYDGVLLFAPDSRYGRPEDFKAFVQTAHAKGFMVLLDVVYNHFGPEGNYLHQYAPLFFTDRHKTPWGDAINFDSPGSHWVRQFFIHNALYWLEEYHLDGLRLDAVHAIVDDSDPDILFELAETVHRKLGGQRAIHLILENYNNNARYLERGPSGQPKWYVAQWNDDIHHALHVLITGERDAFYADYSDDPGGYLARCLSEGFAYQGEPSFFHDGRPRGEPSAHLPSIAFISKLQNHDLIGNRALGERITDLAEPDKVRAATALLLLAPSPPLLFMGEEWGAKEPFLFFCDLGPELAQSVTEGRRREFTAFPAFRDPNARERIPDPMDVQTYRRSILDWDALSQSPHKEWLSFHRELLKLRQQAIIPRLKGMHDGQKHSRLLSPWALEAHWTLGDGSRLTLLANLDDAPATEITPPRGDLLYASHDRVPSELTRNTLLPWSVGWFLEAPA